MDSLDSHWEGYSPAMSLTAREAEVPGTVTTVRVLHVVNRLSGHGGAEVSLRDIVTGSAGGPIDHGIVVLRGDGNVTGAVEEVGVPMFVPAPTALGRVSAVRHVRRAIAEFRPDLVHTSLFESDLAGRVASVATCTPVLTSFVNTPYCREAAEAEQASPWKQRAVRQVDRFLANHATSAFHAISQAAADHAAEHLGVDEERIRVVPRGRSRITLGHPSPERRRSVREKQGWGSRPVVINVARQEPQKGHVLLLEAMPPVLDHHPDALLVLVGRDGRSTSEIEERIRTLDIAHCVVRMGVRTDVADLLAGADVFAFSSLYEGLGGAVVEAAGLEIPVVAFNLPALREVLGDDHPWLIQRGDTQAMGRAINEVLEGGQGVEQVGRGERKRFDERYELQTCIRGMTQLYLDVARAADWADTSAWRRVPKIVLR
jgi:glycosyltransferase involved in cell wall biosynthesis